jgi:spore coat protein CotH
VAVAEVDASSRGVDGGQGVPVEPNPPDGGGQPPPSEPAAATAGTVTAEPMDEAAHVYDPAVVHTFDVEVAPQDLARVDENPAAEQYVPARLTFEGTTYEIGYRYKGSVGAFRPPCTAVFDGGPKAGKCSVKLSFNWMDPEGQFHGLRKLVFHAMHNDPSMMRERLGYGLFREMGVPAPRATHAVLRVNGEAGIYALVEEIDGRFTRSRFTEGGEGNLYKEIWPIYDEPKVYLAALETNEDQAPSAERMLRFKRAVAEGPEAMASWVDLDVTTSYVAVDRVIMNDDGAFHFYCVEGGKGNNPTLPGNHNYFWYEAENADRLWIIPWDLDHSLRESTIPPHLPVDWRTVPSAGECNACQGGGGFAGINGPPPGCDPVIKNFQAWQARYEAKVDALVAGPFSEQAVAAKLTGWKQQLARAGYPVAEAAAAELEGILGRARTNRGFSY